jgi:hypothetical protein
MAMRPQLLRASRDPLADAGEHSPMALIVEPRATRVEPLTYFLERVGVHAIVVSTAREVVAGNEREPCSLVVLDGAWRPFFRFRSPGGRSHRECA